MVVPDRVRVIAIKVLIAVLTCSWPVIARPQSEPPLGSTTKLHEKAFWRSIREHEYRVPSGNSVRDLAMELSAGLSSPDPELRDELATTILSVWIYKTRIIDVDMLRQLIAEWLNNLTPKGGGRTTVPTWGRSFSALMLSVAIARDNADPFLTDGEFRKIWDSAVAYLRTEDDLRGFDSQIGWIHSTAHTADLLKFLARSRYFSRSDQAAMLVVIRNKLSTANLVFTYGEDERLARAVLSVVRRTDFDDAGFATWSKETRPKLAVTSTPNQAVLRSAQNLKNFFSKLVVILTNESDQTPAVRSAYELACATLKNEF
jgi:hypothetical protein